MLKLKGWREVMNLDFPKDQPITERTIQRTREYKGQVRKPYEPTEYESRRTRILNTPLP